MIATPAALHVEQACAALEQRPRRVLPEAARRSTRRAPDASSTPRGTPTACWASTSRYRHTEAARRVRELVADGALGDVLAVDLVFHNAYGPDKAWFSDPALAGGGCVLDLGVHLVDLALWTLGGPGVRDRCARPRLRGRHVSRTTPQRSSSSRRGARAARVLVAAARRPRLRDRGELPRDARRRRAAQRRRLVLRLRRASASTDARAEPSRAARRLGRPCRGRLGRRLGRRRAASTPPSRTSCASHEVLDRIYGARREAC